MQSVREYIATVNGVKDKTELAMAYDIGESELAVYEVISKSKSNLDAVNTEINSACVESIIESSADTDSVQVQVDESMGSGLDAEVVVNNGSPDCAEDMSTAPDLDIA